MEITQLKNDYDLFIFEGDIATSIESLISMIVWQTQNGYNCAGYEIGCLKKSQVKDALFKAKADFDSPLGYFINNKSDVLDEINKMIVELDLDADYYDDNNCVYDFIYYHMKHESFEIASHFFDEYDELIEFDYNQIEILN
ncbi:hypothetical protein [Thorsellia anophelis]|uniref:Uncharacterized protein n=1 Tax=Thorsellia anophelis DSM 18579 TaxID=1123402 RepID=A0A1I0FPE1_9GAMM|nr:hypothetical protein [Thorsellia anophelis]SET60032.1 hypothetical protein SAMN02583745_02837 [Thorsellia anophelis DSM 18579]